MPVFKSVIICAAILSVCCFFAGIIFSYLLEIPVGASVVMVNLIVFTIFTVYSKVVSG